MTNNEIKDGLLQLGFNSGWVINENEITLWENQEPIPSMQEIENAAKLWHENQKTEATAKEAARQAVLSKLGLTAEEVAALL